MSHPDDSTIDEGTQALEEIAEEVEKAREAGASSFAVPEDDPDYVDDEDTIEAEEERDHDTEPDVPVVPPPRTP